MTDSTISLFLNGYAEAVTELGGTPRAFDTTDHEEVIRLIRVYCAGWRHAKNDTKESDS